MKFIVDAQLPRRVTKWLSESGYDAIHTLYLPAQNATQDNQIIALSMSQQRVVVTKDRDFYNAYVLQNVPYKILMITTGNITNNALILLLEQNFEQIIALLNDNNVVEMNNYSIIVHF